MGDPNFYGLARALYTGTWSSGEGSKYPIVLNKEIRGTLQYISGSLNDRLTNISTQRVEYGMLAFLDQGYTDVSGQYTRIGKSYYQYNSVAGDAVRTQENNGNIPNTEANWSLLSFGNSSIGPTGPTGYLSISGTTGGQYAVWNGSDWVVEGKDSIRLGSYAGAVGLQSKSIAIGYQAGETRLPETSIAIGYQAGQTRPLGRSQTVAIGYQAGQTNQASTCLAFGSYAGRLNQLDGGMAFGSYAGYDTQGYNATAIGSSSGQINQGSYGVAIGYGAGAGGQGRSAIAIGTQAGNVGQNTGVQAAGSIAIQGDGFDGSNFVQLPAPTKGLFIKPIAPSTSNTDYNLIYNTASGEINYYLNKASDARLKKNIEDTPLGLDFINKLRPVQFQWKDRTSQELTSPDGEPLPSNSPGVRIHQGLIAQEVKSLLDELGIDSGIHIQVNDMPTVAKGFKANPFDPNDVPVPVDIPLPNGINGIQGIRYDELIGPLIKAVQELTIKVAKLENSSK